MSNEYLTDEALHRREQQLFAAKRKLRQVEAYDKMMPFMQEMQPDPDFPDDPLSTSFESTPLARLLCQVIEKVDRGEEKRVCVSVGPQLGKSQVLSRAAPAWLSGRKPQRSMILGSYNETFASEFGGDVRDIMQSEYYKSIFPKHSLRRGSESKTNLQTEEGGKLAFVGVGGSGTGKRADQFFVDDPYKNSQDADSETYRETVWKWFNGVVFARCHKDSAIIIVHTRWHEDDLIGRLCDPDHPERNKKYAGIADRWTYYNLPAVVEDPELAAVLGLHLEVPTDPLIIQQFGDKPMVSLWENRKSLDFLAEAKQMDKQVFGALYMGSPSPDDGIYFLKGDMVEYDLKDLPPLDELNIYAASDHAVTKKQENDATVLGCVGVDKNDYAWVLPDLVWDRMETDKTVEEMIRLMKHYDPDLWWMEDELISKSFGPFLKKEMHEAKIYTTLVGKRPTQDKKSRARAVQGRMSHKKILFPRFAPWWPDAKKQLLKFPHASHDDFVDWLSWIGLGLLSEYRASEPEEENIIKVGSLAWVKAQTSRREQEQRITMARKGW